MRAWPEGARGGYEGCFSRRGSAKVHGGRRRCRRWVRKSQRVMENTSGANRSDKQEKVSCLVLLEYVVYLGKRREVRLNRRAKAGYRQPSALC